MKISVKSEQREKRIEVNVNIFVEMFVRATRRRENGGRKTRAHTTVWHAGCRPTDCLSPINGLPFVASDSLHQPSRRIFDCALAWAARAYARRRAWKPSWHESSYALEKTPLLVFLFPFHFLLFSSLLFAIFSIGRGVRLYKSSAVLAFSDGRRSFRFGILYSRFFIFLNLIFRIRFILCGIGVEFLIVFWTKDSSLYEYYIFSSQVFNYFLYSCLRENLNE